MTEKQLQAKLVMEFSQLHPERNGLLFAVNNEANSDRQAMTLKALGVWKGASDLIYFYNGVMTGIELKIPGAKHSRDHILSQYDWGSGIALNGGNYYIATNRDSFFSIINGDIDSRVYTLDHIKELLEVSGKMIIFK